MQHGEAESEDVKLAEEYITHFSEPIAKKDNIPQQVLNCDHTGLFLRKMSRRTYIAVKSKKLPKDHLTLALCANACNDCEVKPLLAYHSNIPQVLKSHKISKEKQQVMWRANAWAWVAQHFLWMGKSCLWTCTEK